MKTRGNALPEYFNINVHKRKKKKKTFTFIAHLIYLESGWRISRLAVKKISSLAVVLYYWLLTGNKPPFDC